MMESRPRIFIQWLGKHPNWPVLFSFVVLTAVASRAVLTDLNSVIVGEDNDVYINPWADWWTAKAWQEPDTDLWYTDYLFYPQGTKLAYHSFSHLNTLISLSLRRFFGHLAAYNLAILMNYVLSGFAMFQLARYVTCSNFAAVLAGVVFAFNSHALYQSSHPVLVSIWCFPWATLYIMRAVNEDRIKWAVIAAIFVFLGALTSTLLFILLGIWFGFLFAYMLISRNWLRIPWRILTIFALLSLAAGALLNYSLLSEAVTNGNDSFWTASEESIVQDIFSIFVPHWYAWLKRGVYLGIVPFYLLMLAFQFQRREARLWFLLLVGAYLFSIGPYPELFGSKLDITLPWSLLFAPLLRNMYRMNILMTMGLAMVVAFGWIGMASQLKSKRARSIAAVLVFVAVFGDYTAVSFPHTPLNVSPFYTEFLQDVPDDLALSIFPTGRQKDKRYLYYQTLHGHKMTGGVISRPSESVFEFINGNALLRAAVVDLEPVPIPKDVTPHMRALARANVGYLVLDKTLMDVTEWRAAFPAEPVFEDKSVLVYSTNTP